MNKLSRVTNIKHARGHTKRLSKRSLSRRLLVDLLENVIRPSTALSKLKRRYEVADEIQMTTAMREACRFLELLACRIMIVTDGDTGEVLLRLPVSHNFPGVLNPRFAGPAFSAITAVLDKFPYYYEKRDLLLHVNIMPKASYRPQHGRCVERFGDHLLTYKSWDLNLDQIEAPFPEGNPELFPEVSHHYSPRLGYQGFDGTNWRSDWYPVPDGNGRNA